MLSSSAPAAFACFNTISYFFRRASLYSMSLSITKGAYNSLLIKPLLSQVNPIPFPSISSIRFAFVWFFIITFFVINILISTILHPPPHRRPPRILHSVFCRHFCYNLLAAQMCCVLFKVIAEYTYDSYDHACCLIAPPVSPNPSSGGTPSLISSFCSSKPILRRKGIRFLHTAFEPP